MSAWIWDAFHRETPNQLLLLRRVVRTDAPLASGSIRVAARGAFRVWVDDRFVVHHDVQSSTPGAEAVQVDLTPALRGATSITVTIGVHLVGVGTHHQPRALGGLHVSGSVLDASGTMHALDSDERWETSVPPWWRQNTQQLVWSTGFAEWSDLTLADTATAWAGAVTFPDDDVPTLYDRRVGERRIDLGPLRHEVGRIPTAAWAPLALDAPDRAAALVAAGAVRLGADDCGGGVGVGVGVAAGEADEASVGSADAAYTLYRLRHQVVGFLTLTVDAAAPATIDVVTGETVDVHGWPTATRQRISAVDTVVVPIGRTEHRFWNRRTFRDLAIVVRAAGAVTVSAGFAATTADRPDPVFATDVERYARMHEVSLATVAVGRQDLYEDCPLREGGHYVADARLQAAFDLTTTGATDLSRRSVRQFARSQDDDGMLAALSPSGTRHRIPDFALQWVCQLDEHVRLAADDALLAELLPTLDRAMDWADDRWRNGGFDAEGPGWWSFIDWYDFTPDALQAAMDAQYAAALTAAAALADRAGRADRAARHRERLDEVLATLDGRLHHPHAAMILANALDPVTARRLVDPRVIEDFRPQTGYCMFWVCRALVVLGGPEAARRRLDEYWGGMLDAGAGTWWERWAPGGTNEDQSLCHPWSAGPVLLLPMLALGVDPLARSEADARFEPVLGDVVHASLHTPWGVVRS